MIPRYLSRQWEVVLFLCEATTAPPEMWLKNRNSGIV